MVAHKIKYIIGIDEVGRGPIAGPVTLCAFLVPADSKAAIMRRFRGVKDSKQLTPDQREEWFAAIRAHRQTGRVEYALASVSAAMIDQRGLSWAINTAVRRCLYKLASGGSGCNNEFTPHQCLVLLDGSLKAPAEFIFQKTIVRGDESVPVIALASIVAKVNRDRRMTRLSARYPAYDFHVHKGYGTRAHYRALAAHGPCDIHRRSFLN